MKYENFGWEDVMNHMTFEPGRFTFICYYNRNTNEIFFSLDDIPVGTAVDFFKSSFKCPVAMHNPERVRYIAANKIRNRVAFQILDRYYEENTVCTLC